MSISLFILFACTKQQPAEPCEPEVVVVPNENNDTGTGADTDTGDGPIDTDTGEKPDEYTGARAVLTGWMSSTGIQYGEPGNTGEMAYWTYHLTSLDGDVHTATITPTAFAFSLDLNDDNRFGVDGDDVVAGDIVHFCWFVEKDSSGLTPTVGPSDVGGPELNTMSSSDYPSFEISTDDTDGVTIGFRCNTFDDAPTGTKIATSMDYTVTSEKIFDASSAREDNTGVLPQYYVRID